MSKICQVTGSHPVSGNNVSHANKKTKRRFLPNIQERKFWIPEESRWIKLKVSTRGIRTIDKLGIAVVLKKISSKLSNRRT